MGIEKMNWGERYTGRLKRIQLVAIAAGVLGIVAAVAGVLLAQERFFQAYLFAFLVWSGLSLGCLAFLMLHNLTGGAWGYAVQRLFEAGARTMPLMAVLFIPLLFGLSSLYPWSVAEVGESETLMLSKSSYLNVPFFTVRAVVYFVIWISLAIFLTRWSYQNDESGRVELWHKVMRLSVAGLMLWVLTVNFAAIDWLMSLEPEWFSSIFGWLAGLRYTLGAIALVIVFAGAIWQQPLLQEMLTAQVRNDLGNVLLASLLSWAYLYLMQFLIIWWENIPAEVVWYIRRLEGGWVWVLDALLVFYFALPGLLLLMRPVKRRMGFVVAIAVLILLMHLVHNYWLVLPVFTPTVDVHWLDIALPVGMGGLWLGLFTWQLRRHGVLPLNHPKFQEDLARLREERYESV